MNPLPPPRQRDAATQQLGVANGRGPEGVRHATSLALSRLSAKPQCPRRAKSGPTAVDASNEAVAILPRPREAETAATAGESQRQACQEAARCEAMGAPAPTAKTGMKEFPRTADRQMEDSDTMTVIGLNGMVSNEGVTGSEGVTLHGGQNALPLRGKLTLGLKVLHAARSPVEPADVSVAAPLGVSPFVVR